MNDPRTPDSLPSSGGISELSSVQQDDLRHAARSGAMQVLTVIAQSVAPVTQVIFARLFGAAVFGAYQTSVALLEVMVRGATAGADKAMLRYVGGAVAHRDEVKLASALHTGLRQGLLIGGPLSLALMLCAGIVSRLLEQPHLGAALAIMAPAVVLAGTMQILVQATLGAKQTRPNFIIRGLSEPLFLLTAGTLAALLLGRDLRHIAWAYAGAAVATCATAVFVAGKAFGPQIWPRVWRAQRIPGFLAFSLPLGLSELANAVLQRADVVILTAYAGARSAGIYAAAEFLGRIVANARYAFDGVAAAALSEALHLKDHDRMQYNLRLMTRWVLSVAAPLAGMTIALRTDLLRLFGADFVSGSDAMIVLVVAHLVNASNLGPWILVVSGRSLLMLLGNLACAVLNIGLCLVLIPRYGIVGTAYAVMISVIALHLVLGVAVWRLQRVQPLDRRILKPLLASAAMLGALILLRSRFPDNPGLAIAAKLGTGIPIYIGLLGALGLPTEERHVWDRFLARLTAIRGRR